MVLALALASCGTTLHRNAQGVVQTASTAPDGITDTTLDANAGPTTGGAATPGVGPGSAGTSAKPGGSAAVVSGPADKSPISLGFLLTGTGNAAALGVNTGTAIPGQTMVNALVRAMNAEGGIAGRQIQPVTASTDTASVNWETDFAAACANFTQDHHVAAVLGYEFAFFDSFESCMAKANVVHLSTGYAVSDAIGIRQYPLFYGVGSLNTDHYYDATLRAAVASGFLGPNNVLGVMRGGCPSDTRAWEHTGAPVAAQLGIHVGIVEEISCINGASGTGSAISQIQSAVLRFRSRGVDTVLVEGPPIIIFSSAAESQGWRPRYLVSSLSGGAALTGNVTPEQIKNIHGFGWLPSVDVLPPNQPPPNAAKTRCMALLQSQGVTPTAQGDINAAYQLCDPVFLYEAALKATNGSSAPAAVTAAIDRLGATYSSALVHGGRSVFGGRHDTPAEAQAWAWETGCGCFRYQGQPYPI